MNVRESGRSTRRRVIGAGAAVTVAAVAAGWREMASVAAQEATPTVSGEAAMSDWRFLVVRYVDPYDKEMVQPQEPVPGTRYLGAEVEIRNGSDRPLAVAPGQSRMRTADATESLTSGFIGSDPRIYAVNMLFGEGVRGWVWFGVPEDAAATELVYVPAAPQLRVAVGSPDGA